MNTADFLENFAEQFDETSAEKFTLDTDFKNLAEWDSLIAMVVSNMIKKKYDTELSVDEIESCDTISDLIHKIETS